MNNKLIVENIRIHGNDKRPAKEKQKLRAAKIVYKDGMRPEGHTHTHTRRTKSNKTQTKLTTRLITKHHNKTQRAK